MQTCSGRSCMACTKARWLRSAASWRPQPGAATGLCWTAGRCGASTHGVPSPALHGWVTTLTSSAQCAVEPFHSSQTVPWQLGMSAGGSLLLLLSTKPDLASRFKKLGDSVFEQVLPVLVPCRRSWALLTAASVGLWSCGAMLGPEWTRDPQVCAQTRETADLPALRCTACACMLT